MRPRRLFDTELAAPAGSATSGSASARWSSSCSGYALEKGHSAADWSTRPLPESWLPYAALDVELLVELRDAARRRAGRGRASWTGPGRSSPRVARRRARPRRGPTRGGAPPGIHRVRGRRAAGHASGRCGRPGTTLARQRDIAPGRVLPDARDRRRRRAPTRRPRRSSAALPVFGGRRQLRRLAPPGSARSPRPARCPRTSCRCTAGPATGPPPPHRWADRDPAAAARLAAARAALAELAARARRSRWRTCSPPTWSAGWPGRRPPDADAGTAVGAALARPAAPGAWQIDAGRRRPTARRRDPARVGGHRRSRSYRRVASACASRRSLRAGTVTRSIRDVVFVDGVRTPFGKAGKGIYAETRADDLVIRCIRELLRRNPQLPPERVDEVAIAATTQIGDQGLTIGRTAALLAGLPKTRARLRDRPDVRRRDDRGHHRRRPASRSAPTTWRSPAASSTWAATRWARASTPTRGSSPRSWSTRPRWSWARPRRTCTTGSRTSPRSAPTRSRWPRQEKTAKAYADGKIQPDLVPVATRVGRARLGPGHRGRAAAAEHHAGDAGHAEDAVPPARPGHRRQRGRPQRRRHRLPARRRGRRRASWACRSACGWSATASPASSPR